MRAEAALAGARPVSTVFFGGGTPSLFPGEEIARILDAVRAVLDLAEDAEITLEANPGASDAGRLLYRARYFDRVRNVTTDG